MNSRLGVWLFLLMLIGAAAGGGWLGVTLGERASEPDVRRLTFRDPLQLEDTPPFAVRSTGGFTGFGGPPALDGDVLRAGSVAAVDEGSLTLEDGAGELVVTYATPVLVRRIRPAEAPLADGDTVLVRSVDDVPVSILRVVPTPEPEEAATAESTGAPSTQ
jgi:hypothetical protein